VNVIVRGGEAIPPRGSTRIDSGDRLHILVRGEQRRRVEFLFDRWRDGPIGVRELPVMPPPARPSVFSVRPWRTADGDPARPWNVNGVAVATVLRSRRDQPGALIALVDGRFAVSGSQLIVGGPRAIVRYIREHAPASFGDEQERAWWQEVAGVLAHPPRRAFVTEREGR